MPVILEECEDLPDGFQQLIDGTIWSGTVEQPIDHETAVDALGVCHTQPDVDDSAYNGFMEDWNLAMEPRTDSMAVALPEPDYSKFEDWIPQYIRPEKPCDYCRSRKLNCYIQRGEPFCTPCSSLFRECSLTNSNTLEATNYGGRSDGTFLDTLHHVYEDVATEHGTFTGIKPLKSKARGSGTSTPIRSDDAPGSSKRNGIRFPRHAVKILRDWLDNHSDSPYPTEAQKAQLEARTELSHTQISNWLANARRRRKASDNPRPRLAKSPSLQPTTPAITIPVSTDKPWEELNPLERWKNSPPENDPANIKDIAKAIASSNIPDDDASASPSSYGRRHHGSSNGSGRSGFKAPSTTSCETASGQTSSLSASSAAFSHGSSRSQSTQGSFGSFSSSLAGKKDRRRRRRPAPAHKVVDDKKRIFQCTFCTDTFKSKYDWTRHEKSLHLSLEKWTCAPHGPVSNGSNPSDNACAYCGLQDPSADHLDVHNHRQCVEKGLDARTFYRKDHLRQHLRLMHGCELTPIMESWKSTVVRINSRCGFCAQRFSTWQERVDHLTAHFKAGARMGEWKGCRGLDPAVAAQVTNAMPPYLIGMEAVSPDPFSASNRSTWREPVNLDGTAYDPTSDTVDHQIGSCGPRTTCFEILTIRLAKYAKQMADKGVVMTDDMLQTQARHIVYDCDDSWNQTPADNPEWLDLFKKATGLDFVPSEIGGQGLQIPEDLETYSDLGLRIPFSVQLKAYNQSLNGTDMADAPNVPGPYQRALEMRLADLKEVHSRLTSIDALYDGERKCGHDECEKNIIDTSLVDGIQTPGPRMRRWCNLDMPSEQAARCSRIRGLGCVKTLKAAERNTNQEEEYSCLVPRQVNLAAASRQSDDISLGSCLASSRGQSRDTSQPQPSRKLSYVQRFKYQLSREKARHFETITGAWEDAGTMPAPVMTREATGSPTRFTSTGDMMEFLGGDLGATLPFSNDALTSMIMMDDLGWQLSNNQDTTNAAFDQQLKSIADPTTFDEPTCAALAVDTLEMPWTTAELDSNLVAMHDIPMDTTMHDFSFDDLTFDGMYDMPIDDSLG